MKKIFTLLFCLNLTCSFAQNVQVVVPDGAGYIQDMVLDKEQKYLYTLNNAKVVMWEVATGRQLHTFQLDGEDVYGLAVSNDGNKVAVAANFKTYCFSTLTGKLLFKQQKYANLDNSVIFSPDDKLLYVGTEGISELDAETGESNNKIFGNCRGSSKHPFYIDNNTKLVMPCSEGWEVYDIITKQKLYSHDCGELRYITALPEQGYIIAAQNYKPLQVFDIRTGKVVKQLAAKTYGAIAIASQNSNQLIVCADNVEGKEMLVYNTDDFTIQKKLGIKLAYVNASIYLGHQNTVFVKSEDGLVKLNTQNERQLVQYKGVSADFGFETFSSMEYNPGSGVLNITTDKNNLKTVDLWRMKPLRHTSVNTGIADLAFSALGDTIASFDDAPSGMFIKNIATGKMVKPFTPLGATSLERNLYFFSRDSRKLYYPVTDTYAEKITLMRYDVSTKLTVPVLRTRKLHNVFVNESKDVLAAVETAYEFPENWAVWSLITGKKIFTYAPKTDDEVKYISVSADRKFVLVSCGSKIYNFDISGKLLSVSPELKRTERTGVFPANPGNNGVSATSSDLSLYAFSRADMDISAKGELFVYKKNGEAVHRINAHSADIRRILFSPDDKIIYTISADKSIKIWHTDTGTLIGTLYLFKNSNDFVFIDPDGRFDGSDDGLKQIYFIRNRELIPLDRLFEKYYHPNLYGRIIAGEKFNPIANDIKSAPTVKLNYAAVTRNLEVTDDIPSYTNTTGTAEITVNAEAADDSIDEIRLFHNGKIVNLATRGLFVTDDKSGKQTKKYTLNLLPGLNQFRAVALNSQRTESKPDEIQVNYNQGNTPSNIPAPASSATSENIAAVDKSATLHLIVVGINKYQNEKMSLNYALADATAFKDETELSAKTMISNTQTYFVTDAKADKGGIEAAFKEVQQQAKPQDVFVFYYAGHGVISEKNQEFYLVPTDVTDLHNVDEALAQKGIPSKLLQQYAIDIAAQKQVFILDACQSAGAFAQLLSNDANQQKSMAVVARSTGTHWIAASGSQQFANEFSQLGHGAFTYVLLQGLKGEAAANKMITVNGLKNFLQNGVPALMKKYNGSAQFPASYGFGNDFPVEVMK